MNSKTKKFILVSILPLILCTGIILLYRMYILKVIVPQTKFEIKLQGNTQDEWKSTGITEKNITDSKAENNNGDSSVRIFLDKNGTERFASVTTDNVGKRVAIFIDDSILSAPIVQSPITNGELSITGIPLDDVTVLSDSLKGFYYKPWLKPW